MLDTTKLYQYLQALPLSNKHFLLAYSGGIDSHVLLHALVKLRNEHPGLVLRVAHVHHGLHPDAELWVQHCRSVCGEFKVDFQVLYLSDLHSVKHRSIEEIAREQRYQVLAEVLQEGECLLTAHTRDDQAETVLLQMLRGSGVAGLAAMPVIKPLGAGFLVRPLLTVSRQEILNYAGNAGLQWIEDDSNHSLRFDRNYLRQKVIPPLHTRWPAVNSVLSRVANHCAEAGQLLEELAAEDWKITMGKLPDTLSIPALKTLSPNRQKNLLRFWLRQLELRVPNAKKLQQLLEDFLSAAEDANPLMRWQEVEVRRFADHLYAFRSLPPHDNQQIISWDLQQPLELPQGIGVLNIDIIPESWRLATREEAITVRFRQGGERFRPQNRPYSQSLKKLMQEWRIPPWLRDRIPLIYHGEHLVVVVGFAAGNSE